MRAANFCIFGSVAFCGSFAVVFFLAKSIAAAVAMGLVFGSFIGILFSFPNNRVGKNKKNRAIKRRQNTQQNRQSALKFSDRLANYTEGNRQVSDGHEVPHAPMPFWSNVDVDRLERTDPKPLWRIRSLLQRIRQLVRGK